MCNLHSNNSYSITPTTRYYLWKYIFNNHPKTIIEFGSGISTMIFASYAKEMETQGHSIRILSIDHDRDWLEKTRASLIANGVEKYVTLTFSPITDQQLLDREITAYSIDEQILMECAGSTGFDLCFIDGPPECIGRVGCLPLVAPYLSNKATLLLEDAFRNEEHEILKEWNQLLILNSRAIWLLLIDVNGMAQIRWNGEKNFVLDNHNQLVAPRNSRPQIISTE